MLAWASPIRQEEVLSVDEAHLVGADLRSVGMKAGQPGNFQSRLRQNFMAGVVAMLTTASPVFPARTFDRASAPAW